MGGNFQNCIRKIQTLRSFQKNWAFIIQIIKEPANKPGSVVDSHLSGMFVTEHL